MPKSRHGTAVYVSLCDKTSDPIRRPESIRHPGPENTENPFERKSFPRKKTLHTEINH